MTLLKCGPLLRLLLPLPLLIATGCTQTTVRAVMPNPNQMATGLSVSGQGEAKGAPDVARANIGVEVRAQTAEQATADVNQRMSTVIAALKQAGIADKDLRTNNLSIGFEQEPQPPVVVVPAPVERGKAASAEAAPPPAEPAIRGFYRATNMVEVTVRDLNAVGRIVKLATDAGANNIWGISFELEDPQVLRAQARQKAIDHAKQNAAELARLTGVKLGKIVSVSENDGGGGVYMPMKASFAEARQGGNAPIEQGEITINQQVQLLFEIE